MNQQYLNLCTRCGKERIVSRTWKERAGSSFITITESVCPDKACQSKVNAENKKHFDRRKAMELRSKQRQHHSTRSKQPLLAK